MLGSGEMISETVDAFLIYSAMTWLVHVRKEQVGGCVSVGKGPS